MKNSKKVIIIVLLILVILVLAFLFITFRKVRIIQDLEAKRSQYQDIKNYYLKGELYSGGPKTNMELWNLGERSLWITKTTYTDNHMNIIKRYTDGTITNSYYEEQVDDQITKEATLNEKYDYLILDSVALDLLHTENSWELFKACSFCSIKSEKMNGKDCYKISNFHSGNSSMEAEGDTSIYVDKETGLVIRQMTGEVELDTGEKVQTYQDFEYKFNCVTEEDLAEPDIIGYTVTNTSE